MDNSRLQTLVNKLKDGRIAPHAYVTDGRARDPECGVRGCRWSWTEHLDQELLEIVEEARDGQ